jgi:hypothetical protein
MVKELNNLLDNYVLEVAIPIEAGDAKYICFYKEENGNCPAKEFLNELLERKTLEDLYGSDDKKTPTEQIVAKLLDYLRRWISKGKLPKRPEHYRSITDTPLFELKAYQGRLLLFYDGKICIIAHGFYKQSNKTPKSDKQAALRILKNYQKRKKELLKGELK